MHEPLTGIHGQVGTRSRVVLRMGQQEIEATEIFTSMEPADLHAIPSDSVVHYEREIVAKGMWNDASELLTEAGLETTLWESENEYRLSSSPMRLLAPLMSRMFRKQSLQHLQDFKAYAEQGTDVREAKN